MEKKTRRLCSMMVYGREKSGARTYKEVFDPSRMCEIGNAPPLLPWEEAHVVEWQIDGMNFERREDGYIMYGKTQIQAGGYVASHPFHAASVRGFLRFWPAGYWTAIQTRTRMNKPKSSGPADETELPFPEPSTDSWCCLGANMPRGTHLLVRFFINHIKSAPRECYWSGSTHVCHIWAPPGKAPPSSVLQGKLVVGVEILKNYAVPQPRVFCKSQVKVPALREVFSAASSLVVGQPKLQKSQSLPNISSNRGIFPSNVVSSGPGASFEIQRPLRSSVLGRVPLRSNKVGF